MGSKFLVGAVVAAFSVWGGAWKLADRRTNSVALAAPERAAPRRSAASESLEIARVARTEELDPEPAAAAEPEAKPAPLAPSDIARLIEDLRHDEIKYNALNAISELGDAGPDVLLPLQRALLSDDHQQRLLAGYVLGRRPDAPATRTLADVLVEGFAEEDAGSGVPKRPWIDVSSGFSLEEGCCEVLAARPGIFALALPRLAPLIHAGDPLVRVRTAFVLAAHHSELVRQPVFSTLIEALADNDVGGDARYALRGLVRLCSTSTEALERAWPGRDEQQRALIGHLLSRFSPQHMGARVLSMRDFGQLGFSQGDPFLIEKYQGEP